MQNSRRKQKTVDKDFQDDMKQIKSYLNEGKSIIERASTSRDFQQALQIFSRAILKTSSIQISNGHLLFYYRGLCLLNLRQLEKAEKDFMEGISLADEKGKGLIYSSLGKCYVEMAAKQPAFLEQAIKSYEKAIEYSKNSDGECYLKLAQIYRKIKNNSQAIKYYTNSLKYLKLAQQYNALTQRGLCYRQIGEIESSIQDFLKASQIRNDEASTFFNLGINYLINLHYEESLNQFDQAIKISPNEPQYKNYKGLALYMSGQYQNCLYAYREALKLYQERGINNSEVSQCWYNLGNAHLHLDEDDEAILVLKMAQNYEMKDDQRLKIYYAEGLAFEKKKSIEAIHKFQMSLEIIGTNKQNDLFLSALYHLALNEFKHKKYAQAVRDINKIVQEGCYDKCVYELRGKVYLEDQKYALAQKDFQMVLSMDSNYPQIYYFLGMAKSNLGKIDEAISDFFKAIELGSRSLNILNGISYAYLKAGKAEKALVYVNIALEKMPNNQDFLIQRSMVNLELGQNHKGVQDLTKALTVNNRNPLIYYKRGLCYYKNKQFESAIEDLKKSLQFLPSDQIEHDIYYLIGVSYANRQKFSEAIEPLTKALQLKKLPKYYHERAKCYILLDMNQQALQDLNEVINEQPNNAFAYFRRGLVFKALKMYEDSADNFMKARELSPDDPKLILNKKQIYEMKYRKLCEPGEEQ